MKQFNDIFRQFVIRNKSDIQAFFIWLLIPISATLITAFIDLKNWSVNSVSLFIFSFFTVASLLLFLIIRNHKSRKRKILFLILQFISLTFIFASIYYYHYNQNPSNYNISNNIQNGKTVNEYKAGFDRLQTINKKLLLVAELESNLDTTFDAIITFNHRRQGKIYKLRYGYSFYFSEEITVYAPAGSSTAWGLIFVDPKSIKFGIGDAEFSQFDFFTIGKLLEVKTKEKLIISLDDIIYNLKLQQQKQEADLNSIILVNANLKFIDFYYFSTITMTTTGYGDIIPNSSSVRLIVIIQTIFSVLFIAFGLSLLTTKGEL